MHPLLLFADIAAAWLEAGLARFLGSARSFLFQFAASFSFVIRAVCGFSN